MLTISHLLCIDSIQEEVEEAEVDTSSDDDHDAWMREVLDQLFQVNFVISLRIWIVRLHRHIQPKVTKGKIVVQEAQDEAGAPPMSLASIQVSSFCQPLQCTAALYSSHLKSKPSLSYLTNIRPWRL